ncbi:MAG: Ig-like domain-containing protein [Polaromonas sp.]
MKTFKLSTIAFSIATALLCQPGYAILERTGPIDTANGFPRWYQDTSGVAIELCLPLTAAELAGGHCLLLPGDPPVVPEVFPGQFFDEHFWWQASAALTSQQNAAKALVVLGLEAAFSADVAPGNQIAFTRIRVRLNPVPVTGTYRFIHPYGEETIEGTAGERIFFTDDVGIGASGVFTSSSDATTGRVGPFLLPSIAPGGAEIAPIAGPVPGKLYIADPARLGPVTGSTLPNFTDSQGISRNHNIFRIEGPPGSNLGGPGVNFMETNDFGLMGRIFTGQMPSKVIAERATYERDSSNQKVDVFATAFPTAASRLPAGVRPAGVAPVTSFYDAGCGTALDAAGNFIAYTPPVGALETLMAAQNNARWGQIRPASGAPLPDSVCLKDNSAVDISGQPIPAYHPLPVNDDVTITDALFDPVNSTLTVKATSSDKLVAPTLTLTDFNAPLTSGMVTVPGVIAPPARVRVLSSARGFGESNDVAADNVAAPGGDPVVAGSDVAATSEDTVVVIPVIANDTRKGVLVNPMDKPMIMAIIVNGSKGTAVANNLTGAMTYTPNANANGSDNFTYTLTIEGVTSNIATVSVNITPVNDAPVATADTAGGAVNTPLVINVLANDTDVDGDVLSIVAGSVTAPVGPAGSVSNATANANGTITFTGNLGGAYQFSYQASDGMIATAATPVTVTLSAPETVSATTSEYVTSKNRWKVTGSTSIAATHNLTLKLTSTVAGSACNAEGRVINTMPSTGQSFTFDILGATGLLDPRTTNCNAIRVESDLGGISPSSLIRLK